MHPEIKLFTGTLLIGNRQAMTFAEDKTFLLWSGFMPRRAEIRNKIGEDMLNVVCYPAGFDFNPNTAFEKWATVPVSTMAEVPDGMETLVIPEGLYAMFIYRGNHTEAAPFFRSIFMDWLPRSGFELDDRPHFEILGHNYKNNDPNSEEEVWIPIKKRV